MKPDRLDVKPASKIKAYRTGHIAEAIAAIYLRLKGYRIEATRTKTPVGEIDILAIKGRTLVAVEVKARASINDAWDAITPKNQSRVLQATQYFMSRNPGFADYDIRFDVIVIGQIYGLPLRLRHLDNAWQAKA